MHARTHARTHAEESPRDVDSPVGSVVSHFYGLPPVALACSCVPYSPPWATNVASPLASSVPTDGRALMEQLLCGRVLAYTSGSPSAAYSLTGCTTSNQTSPGTYLTGRWDGVVDAGYGYWTSVPDSTNCGASSGQRWAQAYTDGASGSVSTVSVTCDSTKTSGPVMTVVSTGTALNAAPASNSAYSISVAMVCPPGVTSSKLCWVSSSRE